MSDIDKAPPRVVERIIKMLAMAEESSGASEGERDNAMRMAIATAAKYNLAISDIEKHGGKQQEKRGPTNVKIRNRAWVRECHHAIAKLFFCEYYFIASRIRKNVALSFFIGRESNVVTAAAMAEYVVNSINREAMTRMRKEGHGNPWRLNFQKGAARRITIRCAELRKEAELQNMPVSGSTALVLASVYQTEQAANQKFLEDAGIKLVTHKDRTKEFGPGAHEGYMYGDKVSLHRQIGEQAKPQQLSGSKRHDG